MKNMFYCTLFYLLCFLPNLVAMDVPNTQLSYDSLDICVEHGLYLGYSYLNAIAGLRLVNNHYKALLNTKYNAISNMLQKEAQESPETKHEFNIKTFRFNPYQTACGWAYYYCATCKLPERKPCGWMHCWHTEQQCSSSNRCKCITHATKITLFRLQFAGMTEAYTGKNKVEFVPNITKYVIDSELGPKIKWPQDSSYALSNRYKDNLLDIAPRFDAQDNLCMYKRYPVNTGLPHILEDCINNKGEYSTQDVACTISTNTPISLHLFASWPVFFDTIISNNTFKHRTNYSVIFDADTILSTHYCLTPGQRYVLREFLLKKEINFDNLNVSYLMHIGGYSCREQEDFLYNYRKNLTKSSGHYDIQTNPLGALKYGDHIIRKDDININTLLRDGDFTWERYESVDNELKICKEKSKIILPPNQDFNGPFSPSFLAEVRKKPYGLELLHIWTELDNNQQVTSYNFPHSNTLTEKTYIDLWKQSVNIVLGSMRYCMKKNNQIDVVQETPLLTDEDSNKGYVIDTVEPINQEKGTMAVYLKQKTIWDYMYRPYKHIDLSTGDNTFCRDGFNFNIASYYIKKPFNTCRSLLYTLQEHIRLIKGTILHVLKGR